MSVDISDMIAFVDRLAAWEDCEKEQPGVKLCDLCADVAEEFDAPLFDGYLAVEQVHGV